MKRIIRLTESDLTRIVRRIINEQAGNSIIKVHRNMGGTPDEHFFELANVVNNNKGFIYNCTQKQMRVGDGPESYKPEDFDLDPVETENKFVAVCKGQRVR